MPPARFECDLEMAVDIIVGGQVKCLCQWSLFHYSIFNMVTYFFGFCIFWHLVEIILINNMLGIEIFFSKRGIYMEPI